MASLSPYTTLFRSAVRVPVTPSLAELNVASDADIAVPAPLTPTASMKYSAPTTGALASAPVAVTVRAASVGGGATPIADVTGPTVSFTKLALAVAPQLSTESRRWP